MCLKFRAIESKSSARVNPRAETSDEGSFITFNLETLAEHKRKPGSGSNDRASRKARELEQAYVRSHNAKCLHARRKNAGIRSAVGRLDPSIQDRGVWNGPDEGLLAHAPLQFLIAPSSPYQSATEQSSLAFFQSRILVRLGYSNGPENKTFWHTIVPQLAWQNPALRHALVAFSLGNRVVMSDSRDDNQTDMLRTSLREQNLAIKALTDSYPSEIVMIVGAMVFRSFSLMYGDTDTAYHHGSAALRMLKALEDLPRDELSPTMEYLRNTAQASCDFFVASSRSTTPAALSPSSESDTELELASPISSLSSFTSSCDGDLISRQHRSPILAFYGDGREQQRERYLESLLEIVINFRKLRRIVEALRSNNLNGNQSAQRFTTPVNFARLARFPHMVLTRLRLFYERWTSAPYLQRYLGQRLTKIFLAWKPQLETLDQPYHEVLMSSAIGGAFKPSLFLLMIEEFAFRAGIDQRLSTSVASENGILEQVPFETFVDRFSHVGFLFLSTAAGTDPQLRRDFLELLEVKPTDHFCQE